MDALTRRANLPLLSDSGPLKVRWFQKRFLHRSLTRIFLETHANPPPTVNRDERLLTREAIDKLEAAWLRYQTLSIRGTEDGGGMFGAYTMKKRMKLKKDYEKLEPDVRRAKEVTLARYKHFTICGPDGMCYILQC
jgi:hypothetical protein